MTDLKHYRVGFTKSGEVKPARTKPKRQLTERESRIFRLLKMYDVGKETALEMREVLAKYQDVWPDKRYDGALCSNNLEKLQQNGFVSMIPAKIAVVKKSTEETKPVRKAKFYLSDLAKSDEIIIDPYNWVIFHGKYIATKKYRTRAMKNLICDKIE